MSDSSADDALMAKIASGDLNAFRQLFKKHGGHLLGFATQILKSQEKAEEVTQEIWMKVIRLAPNYNGKGHFVAWLYTLTRHQSLNAIRAQKHERLTDTGTIDDAELRAASDLPSQVTLEDEILNRDDWHNIRERINRLPDNQRVALLLHVVEGCSYEDISGELKCTVAAVKSLIFRARTTLGGG